MSEHRPSIPPQSVVQFSVTGRVQRVGFRWFVREQARALGLAGRVWNEVDGSVSVVVSGSPDALDRLERALARGPDGARVDAVRRRSGTEASDLSGRDAAADPDATAERHVQTSLPYPFAIDR